MLASVESCTLIGIDALPVTVEVELAIGLPGYHVVGLRLPGHGTAPAGLLRFTIEDMRAAVALAVRDLERRMPASKPLLLVGYSNGAALAVDYALRQRADPQTGLRPSGLVLISPSIAISRLAVLARIRTLMSAEHPEEGQLLRLAFAGDESDRPLLSDVIRRFGIDLSIVHGQVDEIQGKPFGSLAVFARGAREQLIAAVAHFRVAGVHVDQVGADLQWAR